MQTMKQQIRAKLAAAAAVGAGCCAGASAINEQIVSARAERLERLRDCEEHTWQPRVTAADHAAQSTLAGPMVVEGLIDAWPARLWTFENLRKRLAHTLVDTGSASGGVPFYLVAHNAVAPGPGRHDLALYVFDANFESDAALESLLADWAPLSSIAGADVFRSESISGRTDRPSWRWLLAGPPGSGTPVHQDPWGYSSWNASCFGVKRWVLFPPEVSHATLHPPRRDLVGRAFAWAFGHELPRSAAGFMDEVLPSLRLAGLGHVELLQGPGEVVAFPAGWWHAVVNLTPTIAVTESFGRPCDLDKILAKLCAGGLGALAAEVEEAERRRGG